MTANKNSEEISDFQRIEQKLDILIALLLRQLTSTQLSEWNNQEKKPFVELLLDMGALNDEIAKTVGMSYGAVANIKSAKKTNRKKRK